MLELRHGLTYSVFRDRSSQSQQCREPARLFPCTMLFHRTTSDLLTQFQFVWSDAKIFPSTEMIGPIVKIILTPGKHKFSTNRPIIETLISYETKRQKVTNHTYT